MTSKKFAKTGRSTAVDVLSEYTKAGRYGCLVIIHELEDSKDIKGE